MSDGSDDDYDEEEDEGIQLGSYEGERNEDGERHGSGKAVLPNGDTYEGQYEKGTRSGIGTYRFKGSGKYTGDYVGGKKHGQGTFWYPDGSRYEGSWVDDQRNGAGVYFYVNADTYEGEWYEHLRHGQGVYTYADTKAVYHGTWDGGQRKGSGELIFASHKYIGYFDENLPKGKGKYRYDLGCDLHGEYGVEEVNEEDRDNEDEDAAVVQKPQWNTLGELSLVT